MDEIEFSGYVRKPFEVMAVEITEENIAALAEYIGTLRHKDQDGSPFIQVNPTLVPALERVYPGFWLTKMNDNIRVYSGRVFRSQFSPNTEVTQAWLEAIDAERTAAKAAYRSSSTN